MNIKLAGTLGGDAVKRYLPDGTPVLEMSVSVYTGGTKESGYKPSLWVRVSCFDKVIIESADLYKKGAKVTITGQPKPLYTYLKDGEPRANFEVVAYQIELGDTFREQQDDMSF